VVKLGAIIRVVQELPIITTLVRMKNSVTNDAVDRFDQIRTQLDQQFDALELQYR